MTFQQELTSWLSPTPVDTWPAPEVGSQAPSHPKLNFPSSDGKPTVVTFLRHCGCPFAEKTFHELRSEAEDYHQEVNFIAVSHSSRESTDRWVIAIGGEWDTKVVVDSEREVYAQWGLGVSNAWHVLNPFSMWNVYKLGKSDGIWNRPTESGNRWQTSGSFAVDAKGVVKWAKVAQSADDIPNFTDGLAALGIGKALREEAVKGKT